MNPFQVWTDSEGNLRMESGPLVAVHGTTVVHWCGDGGTTPQREERGDLRRAPGKGVSFEGGSGRNIRVVTTATGLAALRWWVPVVPDQWAAVLAPGLVITRDETTGALEIGDGTDVVADGAGFSGLTGVASAGTFPITSWVMVTDTPVYRTYEGVEDPIAALYLEKSTGYAEVTFGGSVVVATRGSGPGDDPAGIYAATPDGETDYNGGLAWDYTVSGGTSSATLNSTPYGEATYNGSAPFTVDLEREAGTEWTRRTVQISWPNSTAQAGEWRAIGWGLWESVETPAWTMAVDELGAGVTHDGTDVVATRAAADGAPYEAAGRWISTPYGDATYGGSVTTVAGVASDGDFPALDWRLSATAGGIETWTGVADATRYIELDTATGDALLKDESGTTMGERLGGSLADINGVYPATPDGEAAYNGGAAWDYTVATTTAATGFEGMARLGRAVTLAGTVFVTVTLDAGSGEATGITGPHWTTGALTNTATEAHFPVALVGVDGVPVQVQTGAIVWGTGA